MAQWKTSGGRPHGAPPTRLEATWRRAPLATVLLLAWLGGGLLSAGIAAVVDAPNDLLYAAVHTALAGLALTVLPVVAPRPSRAVARQVSRHPVGSVTTRVPAQPSTPACNGQRTPANA